MEQGTQPRGSKDTTKQRAKDHLRAAAPRAFKITLLVALLVHAPLVPTNLFNWLQLLFGEKPEMVDMEGEVVIPIDLDLMPGEPAQAAPKADTQPQAEADPAAEPVVVKKPEKKDDKKDDKKNQPKDAGPDVETPDAEAPDGGLADAAEDAGTDAASGSDLDAGVDAAPSVATNEDAGPDAGTSVASLPKDAGPDAEPAEVVASVDAGADAGGPALKDPFDVAGSPGDFAAKSPNVKIYIAGDRIRKHELGTWFGRILINIPQWQHFFKDSPIDPIRDLDHMLIAGPQLRDSRKVIAVMDFNVPEPKVKGAVDVILSRSDPPGKWLTGTPVPAAQAKADNGERIFAMVPGKRILVVMPADAKDELKKVKGMKAFNKSSGVGIALSMVTPHRAFKGLPVAIPDTFKWMRLSVTPTDDGGADVLLEAQDKDKELALEHADKLGALVESVRQIDVPILGKFEVLGPTPFSADGDLVRATTHVTNKQLRLIMSKVEQELAKQKKAQ